MCVGADYSAICLNSTGELIETDAECVYSEACCLRPLALMVSVLEAKAWSLVRLVRTGELLEYVTSELNVREVECCPDPLQYATLRAEPDFQVWRAKTLVQL